MTDTGVLRAFLPVILILLAGILATIVSRAARISSMVGYIGLGLVLNLAHFGTIFERGTIDLLSDLGVMFLLFEIGLHFSFAHLRRQASDIFAFGPVQVALSTTVLGAFAAALGLNLKASLLIGVILSFSSTAMVGRLIAERHQQNCPVGLTGTSILVFQDIAAILLLVVAGALENGGSAAVATAVALAKAAAAMAGIIVIAKFLLRPVLAVAAKSRNEEVFTAIALLVAISAGWATGAIGLSLSLGAFLGGLALAETPYHHVIEYEIRPFRGLLLSFFFITIGMSLDLGALRSEWIIILGLTACLAVLKVVANIGASLAFRWSIPGSIQLGFLLGQASEFSFVILALPPVHHVLGDASVSLATAVVVLSIASTPPLAAIGRRAAGHVRGRLAKEVYPELIASVQPAPVIIVGMGTVGRAVADALTAFSIDYYAAEKDDRRLHAALADGYNVVFGDGADMRLWPSMGLGQRKITVLTAPDFDRLYATYKTVQQQYPHLKRLAYTRSVDEAHLFRTLGLLPVVEKDEPRGITMAKAVLRAAGVPDVAAERWGASRTGELNTIPVMEQIAA